MSTSTTLAASSADGGDSNAALIPTVAFHTLDGWLLTPEQGEAVSLAIDVAEGRIDADDIALTRESRAFELTLLVDPDDEWADDV